VFEKRGKKTRRATGTSAPVREYPLSVYALLSLTPAEGAEPGRAEALITALRKGCTTSRPGRFPPRTLYGDAGFLRAVELRAWARAATHAASSPSWAWRRRPRSARPRRRAARKRISSGSRDAARPRRRLERVALAAAPRADQLQARVSEGDRRAKWKLAYPRAFPRWSPKNTKANQLPEALQLAIMREESAFSPRIESFANAIGLTQMLIKTAKRFSNGAAVTREFLQDPAKNLEVGSRFLGFLWKHFDEAAPLAIAGYNAGEGAVDRWLGERGDLAMDEFMETIPFDETRNYTKRVLASYFTYSWLYGKQPVPTVPLAARGKSSDKKDGESSKHSHSAARPARAARYFAPQLGASRLSS
jgi:soluble lytic murein transglycosylase